MVDIYVRVWSLSRLLCCVGSGSNVAAVLHRTATGIGMAEIGMWYLSVLSPKAAFLKLWSADHKWSSVSALVVLLD